MLTGTKAAPDMDWRWDILHYQLSSAVLFLRGFIWRSIGTLGARARQNIFRRVEEGAL